MEAGNAVRILQSHNREHDQRTGPAIEVVLILHKSPQGYVGILAAAEIPKDVLWSARWPSRNRRGKRPERRGVHRGRDSASRCRCQSLWATIRRDAEVFRGCDSAVLPREL